MCEICYLEVFYFNFSNILYTGTPLPFSRVTLEGINFSIESINETDRGIYSLNYFRKFSSYFSMIENALFMNLIT